jgi:hypothetical protein
MVSRLCYALGMDEAVTKYLSRIGRKGGRSKSKVKSDSSRENVKIALAARKKYTPCPRYKNHSHRFSPKTGRCACSYVKP